MAEEINAPKFVAEVLNFGRNNLSFLMVTIYM